MDRFVTSQLLNIQEWKRVGVCYWLGFL
jgi:hypothetical protein